MCYSKKFLLSILFLSCSCFKVLSDGVSECKALRWKFNIIVGHDWGTTSAMDRRKWNRLDCDQYFTEAYSWSDSDLCAEIRTKYTITSFTGWKLLPNSVRDIWTSKRCNYHSILALSPVPVGKCSAQKSPKNGWRQGIPVFNNKYKEPLIAILVSSTSRNIEDFSTLKQTLNNLLSSIRRTVECGFRYKLIIGFDSGDAFFSNNHHRSALQSKLISQLVHPLNSSGISMDFQFLEVENIAKKPVPVFNAVALAAYREGADYFYRINDDTTLVTKWASAMIYSLLCFFPPLLGSVGPVDLENDYVHKNNYFEHDFVHRTHLEIFHMSYYPVEFSDWGCDVWISKVYGALHSSSVESVFVLHEHFHGTRYTPVEPSSQETTELILKGREMVKEWARNNSELVMGRVDEFISELGTDANMDLPDGPTAPDIPKLRY